MAVIHLGLLSDASFAWFQIARAVFVAALQCHFGSNLCSLMRMNDKNHTSLGPHKIGVICGFVFMSDQICS